MAFDSFDFGQIHGNVRILIRQLETNLDIIPSSRLFRGRHFAVWRRQFVETSFPFEISLAAFENAFDQHLRER